MRKTKLNRKSWFRAYMTNMQRQVDEELAKAKKSEEMAAKRRAASIKAAKTRRENAEKKAMQEKAAQEKVHA